MTELKTLKDLPKRKINLWSAGKIGSTDKPLGFDFEISENTLKQEAIEWIKEFEKVGKGHTNTNGSNGILKIPSGDEIPDCELYLREEGYSDGVPLRAWIKYFFNITEEDLK